MSDENKFEDILVDPSAFFKTPQEILTLDYLNNAQKLTLLKRWEQDARELDVAEEEGMIGNNGSCLSEIIKTIDTLDPDYHQSSSAPNKQGNISG